MNRMLFISGNCESQKTSKIKVLAGRSGAFRCHKIQIDVLNKEIKPVDISLMRISSFAGTEMDLDSDSKISTSFFNEVRKLKIRCFGYTEKQAMIFEFYNPLKEDVRIYISLIGENVSTDLVGKE